MDARIYGAALAVLVGCSQAGFAPGQADALREYAGLVPVCRESADPNGPTLSWVDPDDVPGLVQNGDAPGSLVETSNGPVVGCREDGYKVFRRIPYAEAPTGDLRWRPPVPKAPWTTPLDATRFGPWCPQAAQTPPQDEDCLDLAVWTPDQGEHGAHPLPPAPLPVIVWVHGGYLKVGSGMDPLYDGAALARGDATVGRAPVVLVTINYRLGVLGFLAHQGLSDEQGTSGNYGLMDQQLALRWVRDNIARFGGDPDNVTLAGESAGALSTCRHLVAPSSRGLFQRAIMESQTCDFDYSLDDAELQGTAFASAVGCEQSGDPAGTVACLRALPAGDLVHVANPFWWRPDVDGRFLPLDSATLLALGQAARVPVLAGTNANEGTGFVPADRVNCGYDESDYDNYLPSVTSMFPYATTARLESAYPGTPGDPTSLSWWWAASAIQGDWEFVCPIRIGLRTLARGGYPGFVPSPSPPPAPVYAYLFTYGGKPWPYADQCPDTQPAGVSHAAELPFVFDSTTRGPLDPDEQALADTVMGYWTQFAATGDPNGGGAPVWPAFDVGGTNNQVLGIDGAKTGPGLHAALCDDLWRTAFGLPPF